MKKVIHLLLLVLFCTGAHAQNYNAGSPVYDSLIVGPGYAFYNPSGCYSFMLTFHPSLIQDPAGTQVYFKITSGTMPMNSLHETSNGILNVGDSFALTPSNCSFEFYSSSTGNSNFNYAFLRCGTPVMQGDSFICRQGIQEAVSYVVDGCMNYTEQDYYPGFGADSCGVDGPLAVSQQVTEQPGVFVDPLTNSCRVKLPVSGDGPYRIRLIDMNGRTVLEQNELTAGSFEIGLSPFSAGVYLVEISGKNTSYSKKITRN